MRIALKSDKETIQNDLFNLLFSKIYQLDVKDITKSFYDSLRKKVLKSRELFGKELDKLSDYDFMMFANTYYNVSVDDSEYIDIYNETNGKKYVYYGDFRTNTFCETPIITSNEGIRSSWVLTNAKIAYKVLLSDTIPFDPNREYPMDEMNKMIENKDLVLLDIVYHVDDDIDKSKYTFVDSCLYRTYPFVSCHDLYNDYFQAFIRRLRLVLTNKRKFEDIRDYFVTYKQVVDSFLSEMPYLKAQNAIAKSTLDVITSSEEYRELEDIVAPKTF